jgi:hypothetical protein
MCSRTFWTTPSATQNDARSSTFTASETLLPPRYCDQTSLYGVTFIDLTTGKGLALAPHPFGTGNRLGGGPLTIRIPAGHTLAYAGYRQQDEVSTAPQIHVIVNGYYEPEAAP